MGLALGLRAWDGRGGVPQLWIISRFIQQRRWYMGGNWPNTLSAERQFDLYYV